MGFFTSLFAYKTAGFGFKSIMSLVSFAFTSPVKVAGALLLGDQLAFGGTVRNKLLELDKAMGVSDTVTGWTETGITKIFDATGGDPNGETAEFLKDNSGKLTLATMALMGSMFAGGIDQTLLLLSSPVLLAATGIQAAGEYDPKIQRAFEKTGQDIKGVIPGMILGR